MYYLVQLYELGVGPRHLDGYLHDVLLLRHAGSSRLHHSLAVDNENDEQCQIKGSHHVTYSMPLNKNDVTFTTWTLKNKNEGISLMVASSGTRGMRKKPSGKQSKFKPFLS